MNEFIGSVKVEINDKFLDQVIAARATRATAKAVEHTPAPDAATARAQAREFVKAYFSPGEER